MLLLRELPDGLGITGADFQDNIRLYYSDGMVCDMTQDYSCRTCKHWDQKSNTTGPVDIGDCARLAFDTAPDFGCTSWQPRVPDPPKEPPCPKCDGKGYVVRENWHEAEIWHCECTGKWGEV